MLTTRHCCQSPLFHLTCVTHTISALWEPCILEKKKFFLSTVALLTCQKQVGLADVIGVGWYETANRWQMTENTIKSLWVSFSWYTVVQLKLEEIPLHWNDLRDLLFTWFLYAVSCLTSFPPSRNEATLILLFHWLKLSSTVQLRDYCLLLYNSAS